MAEAERDLGFRLPAGLGSLYERADGVFHERGQCWVVWPLQRLVGNNPTLWNSRSQPPNLLAFGDDGSGNSLCVRLNGTDEVIRWNWIDDDIEEHLGTLANFSTAWLCP